ncbi:MAG: transcriptional regulator, CdaR [Neobacillus sp.]|nr:transcriptional regulator, CdaR [Neobacillus sp.]
MQEHIMYEQFKVEQKEIGLFSEINEGFTHNVLSKVNEVGIEDYLAKIEESFGHQILLTNDLFEPVINHKLKNYNKKFVSEIKHLYYGLTKRVNHYLKIESLENEIYFLFELKTKASLKGFFIIKEIDKVTEIHIQQYWATLPVLMSELVKRETINDIEKKYQQNFIYDLLHNNLDSHYSIINQGSVWGWDLSLPHQLILMKIKDQYGQINIDNLFQIERIIYNTLSKYFYKSIVVEINGLIVIIFSYEKQKGKNETKEEMKFLTNIIKDRINEQFKDKEPFFGIGRFYPQIKDLCRSYQEGKLALQLSTKKTTITHYEDLGITRLLASLHREQIVDFSQEYLTDLIVEDKQQNTELLTTLEVYLNENMNLKSTADKLFIHPNTLRNHIKKIESTLRVDLQNTEDIVNLFIALKIRSMNINNN